MEEFIKYLERFTHITPEHLEEIKQFFRPLKLKKGEYLYQQSGICNYLGFVVKGVMRSFYYLKGEEITRFIVTENYFVTAFSSFISRKSSPENIQAVTDAELLVITYEDLQVLYQQHPIWQELGRKIVEESHLRQEQRVLSLITYTAEERYRALSISHPDLIRRVPLQYIASLLGIKPETLSRIRKKVIRD